MKAFLVLLAILILTTASAAQVKGDCRMYVAENGQVLVLLVLEGDGIVEVNIPVDVPYPKLEGAVYVQTEDGVEIALANDTAILAYKSSLMTSKKGEEWTASYPVPDLDELKLTMHLPSSIILSTIQPTSTVTHTKHDGHHLDAARC
ncbi:MAG: hypothetical protein NTU61_04595 [Candidatus Altiarchaeota archaeon]|nr:hypothetical protein [Candidatus Altiarchaeota archaeon]